MPVDLMEQLAIDYAQLQHGRIPRRRIDTSRSGKEKQLPASALAGVKRTYFKQPKALPWTKSEDAFLKGTIGLLTEEDIASELHRTVIAVHLRWKRDLNLPAPSKEPSVITANGAAIALGIDGHKTAHWVDCGLIPGRIMPGKRKIRLIERVTLLRWACAPVNWMWFDPKNVQDPHLKRLIELEAERWGDEWWSNRKAAEYHGVPTKTILSQIQLGRLPSAYRLPFSRGGRDLNRYWSNWYVLRSEVEALKIPRRRGVPGVSRNYSVAADAWILKSRDQLGMTFEHIGITMKIRERDHIGLINKAIDYRYRKLKAMAAVAKQKKAVSKSQDQKGEETMASKRHERRKSCDGKRAFGTMLEATHHAGLRTHISGSYITDYHCKFCKKYHVGHPTKEVRRALRARTGMSI